MLNKALIVGCGSIGRRHLRNLKALGVQGLLAFDPAPDRLRQAAQEAGAAPCASLEDGLARGPELAVIATPSSLHLEPALKAARADCHLFIEKPLSHSLDGVDALEAEVSRRGLVALVGCNMRFHPGVALVLRLLREGAIGKVSCARLMSGSYLPDWHPSEDYRKGYSARSELGGGVILDGIHELDYLLAALGPAEEVSCLAGRFGDLEVDVEDAAEIAVRFQGGALAGIHLDYLQRAYRRSCQFSGAEGTIEWDYDRPEIRLYRAKTRCWEALPVDSADPNRMYLDEMKHLLACLEGKEKPAQDLPAARAALALALAAKRSSQTGARVSASEAGLPS